MMRKKKNSDIFEGTFLEGLIDLDEKETSEELNEIIENEQILGVLLFPEIKLYVLSYKKFLDYIKLRMDLFTKIMRPKTPDKAVEYLQKMVLTLQQFEVLRKLVWVSVSSHIDKNGSFISLFNKLDSNRFVAIKKGFRIVSHCIDIEEVRKERESHNFKYFTGKAWEDYYFKGKSMKGKSAWKKHIEALNDEIARILYK